MLDNEAKVWDHSQITRAIQVLEMMLETQINIKLPLLVNLSQNDVGDIGILQILFSTEGISFLELLHEGPLEDLCNEIYNLELEDTRIAYQMSSVRRQVASSICSSNLQREISSTCYFNSSLHDVIQMLAARNASIRNALPYDLVDCASKKEEDIVQNLAEYVQGIGWENVPFGEREELLLCIGYHYFSKSFYVDVSNLIMEVMETGVANPLIYMLYFKAALKCKEYDAALEAYNAAVDSSPSFAILPADRYEVNSVLSTNIFEEIYCGLDKSINIPIFIKVLKNPPSQAVENIKESGKLKHSKILEVLDVKQVAKGAVVVTEYFESVPLMQYIAENGPLDLDRWQEIAMQILGAVAHAHDFGLAHGYLSPHSILYDGENIKMSNFGFCVGDLWGEGINQYSFEQATYFAPEVRKSEALALSSDVYSLGKILSYLLTGNANDPFNDSIPDHVRSVIAKSIKYDHNERYANAEEIFKSLVESLANPSESRQSTPAEPKAAESPKFIMDQNGKKISLPEHMTVKGDKVYNNKDGSVMVLISEGSFSMGSTERNSESPIHDVHLSSYLLDLYPVTNKQYMRFLQETSKMDLTQLAHPKQTKVNNFKPKGWRTPEYSAFSDLPNSPVIFVDWWDAWAYAKWAGKSLPTEAEWEKAARGNDGRMYPWGQDLPTTAMANFGGNIGKTTPVGSYPEAMSPYGCLDMVGNISEWCYDTYDPNFYRVARSKNPVNRSDKLSRVVRGGSWTDAVTSIRNTVRGCWMNTVRYNFIGFRCVYRLDPDVDI
ncbi:SUMF1/EgtB/PvdO family nonheme iron enzyme [Candidatus Uabimicrobium amorphum]|uniref:Protein NirV n=1 Tax=Uabimicrobium amorphum TaxID=2596890 RepID=A0A5S9F401_UABAM|nr:SUMF1/EgtB/PvdO family nonheme iron enzyme [Candidatus Uabimicrobium amorphum]BBM85236.1 protein NirV [Candidatus Uabimicrobium amorphum]